MEPKVPVFPAPPAATFVPAAGADPALAGETPVPEGELVEMVAGRTAEYPSGCGTKTVDSGIEYACLETCGFNTMVIVGALYRKLDCVTMVSP